MNHEVYMRRAIELAKKGVGFTSPNPMVGAVIVKDGEIIGEGYHERCGDLHAERNAFKHLTKSAEGASIYVTLEPCCHYGKQPPCTEAIIEHGIQNVYIGSRDPNPLVAGKGVFFLREHGITVHEDLLRDECDAINDVFFHYITTKRPYVVTKYAMTLDGKIATHIGASKWITGEKAREHVQSLRGRYSAILAGIGTVIADDPMLNCRIPGLHQPLRVILDSKLRISTDCQLVRSASEYQTLIVCAVDLDNQEYANKVRQLMDANLTVISLPDDNSEKVSIEKLLEYLGENQIDSILVEGGGEVHDAFRKAGAINQIDCYIAPKLFGGKDAKTPVEGIGVEQVIEATTFKDMKVIKLGEDILIEAKRNWESKEE